MPTLHIRFSVPPTFSVENSGHLHYPEVTRSMGNDSMSDNLSRDRTRISLSHLDRERIAQGIERQLKFISDDDLRQLRAWLLDVIQLEMTVHMELAELVGTMVHAEVSRREGRPLRALMGKGYSNKQTLVRLASFPDLDAPEHFRKQVRIPPARPSANKSHTWVERAILGIGIAFGVTVLAIWLVSGL